MISDDKIWHYVAVAKLSTLLRGRSSKNMVIFISCNYFFICLEQYKNYDFHDLIMTIEKKVKVDSIPKIYQGITIYSCRSWTLIKKMLGCENNSEKKFTTKVGEHAVRAYSLSTIYAFDEKKYNK